MTCYVKFTDGLGNQLFQYNFGEYLTKQGYTVKFLDACTNRQHCVCHMHNLYNITLAEMPVDAITIREGHTFVPDKKETLKNDYIFQGYFQKPCYIRPLHIDYPGHLSPIKSTEYCGIHVRLGDYCAFLGRRLPSSDYYKRAIKLVKKKFGEIPFKIFIENPNELPPYIPELCSNSQIINGDTLSDFKELTSCQVKILADSTFSLFAGYFNRSSTVYFPYSYTRFFTFKHLQYLSLSDWKQV